MIPLSGIQLLKGNDAFVAASTPKTAPTLFVKANWNDPLVPLVAPVSVVAAGIGTLMLTMLLVLGMPLTNTVAIAKPGGKLLTGVDVKEFVDQLVQSRNEVCALSRLRNWTSG